MTAIVRRVLARALLRERDPDARSPPCCTQACSKTKRGAREVVDEFCINAAQPQAVLLLRALLDRQPAELCRGPS
jgi:hypothetical protein